MKPAGALLIFLLSFFPFPSFGQGLGIDREMVYSVSDLQSDLRYLHAMLEKIHPNLYLYTPKQQLDLYFDSLQNALSVPMTSLAFYNLISTLHARIKDGHTMLLPADQDMDYFKDKGRFIPLRLYIQKGHLYATSNCSADTMIKAGAEILSINGTTAATIISHLMQRQIRDGYNQTYPLWILNTYFTNYFQFSFGEQQAFEIVFRNDKEAIRSKLIPSLSRDSIRYCENERIKAPEAHANPDSGISYAINSQKHIAILTIRTFDEELLKTKYHQDFAKVISASFLAIKNAGVNALILDLRNNQGGDFEPGRALLRLLILEPLVYLTKSNQQSYLKPEMIAYRGKLFVLINGGSFSSTGIVCSYLNQMRRASFIGEEAGGNKTIISGDPTHLILPNTKINLDISTRKYLIRNTRNDGHGVQPDYLNELELQDIISNKDGTMDFAVKLALKEKILR